MVSVAALVGFVLLSSFPQSYNELLAGIREVDILVEELTDADRACGLSEDTLTLAPSREILDGGLRLRDGDAKPFFYLSTLTLHIEKDDTCVSFYRLSVMVPGKFTSLLNNGTTLEFTEAFLRQGIMTSERPNHPKRISDRMRDLARQAVTAVKRANQKP